MTLIVVGVVAAADARLSGDSVAPALLSIGVAILALGTLLSGPDRQRLHEQLDAIRLAVLKQQRDRSSAQPPGHARRTAAGDDAGRGSPKQPESQRVGCGGAVLVAALVAWVVARAVLRRGHE